MKQRLIWQALPVVLVLFVWSGCSEDSDPTVPNGGFVPGPTLENVWPNADGNSWSYAVNNVYYDCPDCGLYADPDDVPPMPSLEDLYADLESAPQYPVLGTASGTLSLQFNGLTVRANGDTAQVLERRLEYEEGNPQFPILLGGGAWIKNDAGIWGYGNWPGGTLSWV